MHLQHEKIKYKLFFFLGNQMEDSLKLYTRFIQEHPTGVFLITRNCDAKIFMYIAKRQANTLVGDKVKCMSAMLPDFHKEEPIAEIILNEFFKLHLAPITGTSKHEARMAAFPKRSMILNLKKKQEDAKHEGHITATSTFLIGKSEVPNVQLLSMCQIMTFDENEIPDLQRVHFYGCVHKDNLAHVDKALIKKHCQVQSETQYLIEEVFEVTDEMRKRFDIKTLAAQWLLAKVKIA